MLEQSLEQWLDRRLERWLTRGTVGLTIVQDCNLAGAGDERGGRGTGGRLPLCGAEGRPLQGRRGPALGLPPLARLSHKTPGHGSTPRHNTQRTT